MDKKISDLKKKIEVLNTTTDGIIGLQKKYEREIQEIAVAQASVTLETRILDAKMGIVQKEFEKLCPGVKPEDIPKAMEQMKQTVDKLQAELAEKTSTDRDNAQELLEIMRQLKENDEMPVKAKEKLDQMRAELAVVNKEKDNLKVEIEEKKRKLKKATEKKAAKMQEMEKRSESNRIKKQMLKDRIAKREEEIKKLDKEYEELKSTKENLEKLVKNFKEL